MLTPAEAEKLILDHLTPFHREDCPISGAQGRVLRQDLRADRDLPPFDRVMMDGFAVRSSAVAAGVRTFRIEGLQAAGMRAFKLAPEPDASIEVMTGAVLPEGADCVVPYEETRRHGPQFVLTGEPAAFSAGGSIHRRGSDHRLGTTIVRTGTVLNGRQIAVAAACGYSVLTVTQSPRIAVVATGDELVEVESRVAAHQIRRSNDHGLRASLIGAGYPQVSRFHLRDVRHEIEHLLWHVIAEFDCIVITGGVSKGKFDFVPTELERQGVKKILHGVAQRPGKPLWFGVSGRGTPVFALPGNPVSASTCLHRYVLPALAHASGRVREPVPTVALASPVMFPPTMTYFLPVKLASAPRAERLAQPDPSNTSGDFAGLVHSDGFVELPPEPTEFPAGTLAGFWPWF